jgi:hypothetical protein
MTSHQLILAELRKKKNSDLLFSICLHEHLKSYIDTYPVASDEILEAYHDVPQIGFKAFLKDFSVGRNLKSETKDRISIIKILFDGVSSNKKSLEIAEEIQKSGLSIKRKSGKHDLPVSMVSKVYMLYRPDLHFPYDSFAEKALKKLGYKVENKHESYEKSFLDFQKKNASEISEIRNEIKDYEDVNKEFQTKGVKDFHLENFLRHRITDKLLWVKGNPKTESAGN